MASFDITTLVDKLIGFLPEDLQDKAKGMRKALVASVGSLLTVLTMVSERFGFLLPEKLRKPVTVAISILTAFLTYATPNDPVPVLTDVSGA